MKKLLAPFASTKVYEKVGYCNRNIIPLLLEMDIKYNMNTMRIIFCGRKFPMKYIDNGEAEKFIKSLIRDEDGQTKLELFMGAFDF